MKSQGVFSKMAAMFFPSRAREPRGSGHQPLAFDEKDMIRKIHELSTTTVKEVMVPRIDVVFISLDLDLRDVEERVVESGYSRFPVFKGTIDNVVGMLYVKDLLRMMVGGKPAVMADLVRKPYFVPESKRLDSLLREMKRRRVHIAVAVDEYGGVSGIVCLEDILEEIVGDIQDEFDNEREDIVRIGEGIFLCDARVKLEDFNEALGVEVPYDDFDTLGGYVFELFGKIPVRYEKVTYKHIDFIIQDMDGHKIRTVKVVVNAEGAGRED